jgi:hypothetical protein
MAIAHPENDEDDADHEQDRQHNNYWIKNETGEWFEKNVRWRTSWEDFGKRADLTDKGLCVELLDEPIMIKTELFEDDALDVLAAGRLSTGQQQTPEMKALQRIGQMSSPQSKGKIW